MLRLQLGTIHESNTIHMWKIHAEGVQVALVEDVLVGGNVVANHVVGPPVFQGAVSVGLLVGLLLAPRIDLAHIVNPEDCYGGLGGESWR